MSIDSRRRSGCQSTTNKKTVILGNNQDKAFLCQFSIYRT